MNSLLDIGIPESSAFSKAFRFEFETLLEGFSICLILLFCTIFSGVEKSKSLLTKILEYSLITSIGSPNSFSRPLWRRIDLVHSLATEFKSWDTRIRDLPLDLNCSRKVKHFIWNLASPTASASSIIRTSASTCIATEKASLRHMPVEKVLTGW